MAVILTHAKDETEDLAALSGTAVLGRLTIPGRPEHVREARAFAARTLTELGAGCGAVIDTAVLLTSELVTNSVRHSRSRDAGGSIALVILQVPGGVQVEVSDEGSALSAPAVRENSLGADGHGLYLVDSLAEQWGWLRGVAGTTVWFRLPRQEPVPAGE